MKIVFGLVFLGLAVLTFCFIDNKQAQVDNIEYDQAVLDHSSQMADNAARSAINNAKSLGDLHKIKKLPKELAPYHSLKEAMFIYKQGEVLIERAAQIENALHVPVPPSIHEDEDDNTPSQQLNPKTAKLLKESQVCYEQARKIVDNLAETTDKDFNYHLNYLKGLIYHRYLIFFSSQENATELFNQSITHYKNALKNKPSDVDTVINIELLIKDGKGFAGASPRVQRNKMLNIRKAGLGTRTGN